MYIAKGICCAIGHEYNIVYLWL